MSTHRYSAVNPLINPVSAGDCIISKKDELFYVNQGMGCDYWLENSNGQQITAVSDGQIAICAEIYDTLVNL